MHLPSLLTVFAATMARAVQPPPNDPDLATAEDPSLWREDNVFLPIVGDRFDGFDWRLSMEVARLAPRHDNFVVSPASAKLLLAMLYEGATGATAAELEDVLQLSRLEPGARRPEARRRFSDVVAALQEVNPDFQLVLSLRMFIDDNFTPRTRFNKILRYFYKVELDTVDFKQVAKAANVINSWVKKSTKGYIEDLVKGDELRGVQMLLAMAASFDGNWLTPFAEDESVMATFFARPGFAYKTPFMTQVAPFYQYNSSAIGAQILRLPFMGNEIALYVVLPHERDALDDVLKRMTPNRVRQLKWNLTLAEGRVFLPHFALDTLTDLKEVLLAMGLRALFDRDADLRGVGHGPLPLFVDAVVQKAFVQANEKGTVAAAAAAATETSTTNRFGASTKNEFNACHPFLFIIEHEATATVLFVGKVSEPRPAPPQPRRATPACPDPAPAASSASRAHHHFWL